MCEGKVRSKSHEAQVCISHVVHFRIPCMNFGVTVIGGVGKSFGNKLV